MDNFFEILLYIFIIVSFISAFFKKKNQQKKDARNKAGDDNLLPQNQEQSISTTQSTQSATESFDIVKEMEQFFQVGRPDEKQISGTSTSNIEDKIKEEIRQKKEFIEVPEESFHKRTSSEHTLVDPWDKKPKEIKKNRKTVDTQTVKKADKFEQYLKVRKTAATDIVKNVKHRLKEPSSLKEYIIISEIIGKPKALK